MANVRAGPKKSFVKIPKLKPTYRRNKNRMIKSRVKHTLSVSYNQNDCFISEYLSQNGSNCSKENLTKLDLTFFCLNV